MKWKCFQKKWKPVSNNWKQVSKNWKLVSKNWKQVSKNWKRVSKNWKLAGHFQLETCSNHKERIPCATYHLLESPGINTPYQLLRCATTPLTDSVLHEQRHHVIVAMLRRQMQWRIARIDGLSVGVGAPWEQQSYGVHVTCKRWGERTTYIKERLEVPNNVYQENNENDEGINEWMNEWMNE